MKNIIEHFQRNIFRSIYKNLYYLLTFSYFLIEKSLYIIARILEDYCVQI